MSNRVSSKDRHKVDRKRREAKRDMRKAAKAMKKAGLKLRPNRKRDSVRAALAISKHNPDKMKILETLLASREAIKVAAAAPADADAAAATDGADALPRSSDITKRLVMGIHESCDTHVKAILGELHGVIDCFAIVVDVRCAVQSTPWAVVDSILADTAARNATAAAPAAAASKATPKKKGTAASPTPVTAAASAARRHLIFVFAKCDLVPLPLVVSSMVAVSRELVARAKYAEATAPGPRSMLVHSIVASGPLDNLTTFALKGLRKLAESVRAERDQALCPPSDVKTKCIIAVIGLPHTGKTTFARSLVTVGGESSVSTMTVGDVQRHSKTGEEGPGRISLANAKSISLLQLPSVQLFGHMLGGDVVFRSVSAVEKHAEPEQVAALVVEHAVDKVSLCQAFSLPAARSGMEFLKHLGRCILREKGFHPASLYTDIGGQQDITLLGASAAQGSALMRQRIRRVRVRKTDGKNALRIGSRTFLKEFCEGSNFRWAAVAPHAEGEEKEALQVFTALDAVAYPSFIEEVGAAVRNVSCLMPASALFLEVDAIVPPLSPDDDEDAAPKNKKKK